MNLPWIERLDLVNDPAELAPEQALQMQKYEQKRANLFAGNAKIKSFSSEEDPVLNDFRREMTFHRQAQAAVLNGIKRLHALNIPTKRPDDYFAEMAKTDEHMQKIRSNLSAKQQGQAKSERLKQIREQRKMGKLIQRQARVQKEAEKRDMLNNLKKFRKGKLKNLDFLDDNRKSSSAATVASKRKARDSKFGFGGKKRGLKRNTKDSSMDTGGSKPFNGGRGGRGGGGGGRGGKGGGVRGGAGANKPQRLGKNKRVKSKAKGGR